MKAKIIFPEAENEYVQAALARLDGDEAYEMHCEPMSLADTTAALRAGQYDAMVAGVDLSSRDVILASRDGLGMRAQTFSSLFVCRFPDGRVLCLADGATCKNPSVAQLADIVEMTADASGKILGEEARVAMLSFSTFGSGGKDPSMDKIRETIAVLAERRPDILVEGEMQLDAAVNPRVAAKKTPADSRVAGRANVLVVPDINSGNILYKSFEQFAGAKVAGPILLGFNYPVSDLSRGSTPEDILYTAECLTKLI